MKILVTGASGFVGSRLVPLLIDAGHEVITPPKVGEGGPDLAHPQSFEPYFQGVEAVIHLAAFNPRAFNLASLNRRKMTNLNVNAAAQLAKMAARNGCELFVFASSARVYGVGHSPYAETAPLLAEDNYGLSKVEAESAILSELTGTTTSMLIFRLPVFAEKPGGLIALFKKLAGNGIPLPLQAMEARKSVIHVTTFRDAVLAALAKRAPAGGIFNLADKEVVTLAALCAPQKEMVPNTFRLNSFLNGMLRRLPLIGYAWAHASADCVLDRSRFQLEFAPKTT